MREFVDPFPGNQESINGRFRRTAEIIGPSLVRGLLKNTFIVKDNNS